MFTLTIKTGNAAFCNADGNPDAYSRDREIAILLRKVARRLEDGCGLVEIETIQDTNGNTVGKWKVKD